MFIVNIKLRLSPLLNSRFFEFISYAFILNPIFLSFQLYEVLFSEIVQGLSSIMIIGFGGLNILTGLIAVKAENLALFVSSILSFILCISIFLVIMVRFFHAN